MGIELSLLKNDFKDKLSIVILCAGEGTRLKEITKNIPKPLIKIEILNNTSILNHTINNLINLGIKQIAIVIGYLGDTIRDFISTIIKNNGSLQDKLIIINTENQYKLGPLYSFLSITKNKTFFNPDNFYIMIPAEIVLKRISQVKLSDIPYKDVLNQFIPIFALSYDSINEILKLKDEIPIRTVWETINYMIVNGKKIFAFEIENKDHFYDIDNIDDLTNLNKKKEDNRRSD